MLKSYYPLFARPKSQNVNKQKPFIDKTHPDHSTDSILLTNNQSTIDKNSITQNTTVNNNPSLDLDHIESTIEKNTSNENIYVNNTSTHSQIESSNNEINNFSNSTDSTNSNDSNIESNPKHNIKRLFLDYNNLNYESFKTNLLNKSIDTQPFNIISKLKYDNHKYCMLGKQESFDLNTKFSDEERSNCINLLLNNFVVKEDNFYIDDNNTVNKTYIEKLSDKDLKMLYFYNHLNLEVAVSYYEYGIKVIDFVQVNFIPKDNSLPKLKTNVNQISFNKDFVHKFKTKQIFSKTLLPLTLDERYYGKKMFSTSKYFQLKTTNNYNKERLYINKQSKPITKIVVTDLDEFNSIKKVYDFNTNTLLAEFIDTNIGNNCFKRKTKNIQLTIKDNNVIQQNTSIKFNSIKISKKKKNITTYNENIGSFDLETYVDGATTKVYSIGFSTLTDNNKPKTFYLGSDENTQTPNDLIKLCIDTMLSFRYNNCIFYTHNLGGFDAIFIIKTLLEYNQQTNSKYYTLIFIFRDSKILRIDLRANIKKTKISFVDSLNILEASLDSLCKSFNTISVKGLFPYSFVNSSNLNYIGATPPRKFFMKEKKIISELEYEKLFKHDWNLKEETIFYLENDLKSLLEVMVEFNRFIFINYNIQVTDCLTISSLALNIYLQNFLNNKSIPIINKHNIYCDIKQAYFGGNTEVYKPYGKDLYYYDVNSLYPFVALKPMVGVNCEYIENYNNSLELNNLFGFFYCKIKTPNDYLGLLPVRLKNNIVLPNGTWEGWYFSELLKFAVQNGYEVEVIKGYNFDKTYNLFTDYINNLYNLKANSTGAKRTIAKYLLNSLLGRFGLDILRQSSKLVNFEEYKDIIASRKVTSERWITNNDIIVSFEEDISKEICKNNNVDYFALLNEMNKDPESNVNKFTNVSIAISAAVTAYAHIFMSEIKLSLLKQGVQIYYMDTDSIVTDKPLDANLVGQNIGQFKLEYEIKEGFFISNKTYCLFLKKPIKNKETGELQYLVIKAKGVFDNSLTLNDFKDLYNNQNVKAVKGNTIKNWKEGYVLIDTKIVTLNYDSYTKRTKIYDSNGNWIDTKPLIIQDNKISNEVYNIESKSLSLIPYKSKYLIRPSLFSNNINLKNKEIKNGKRFFSVKNSNLNINQLDCNHSQYYKESDFYHSDSYLFENFKFNLTWYYNYTYLNPYREEYTAWCNKDLRDYLYYKFLILYWELVDFEQLNHKKDIDYIIIVFYNSRAIHSDPVQYHNKLVENELKDCFDVYHSWNNVLYYKIITIDDLNTYINLAANAYKEGSLLKYKSFIDNLLILFMENLYKEINKLDCKDKIEIRKLLITDILIPKKQISNINPFLKDMKLKENKFFKFDKKLIENKEFKFHKKSFTTMTDIYNNYYLNKSCYYKNSSLNIINFNRRSSINFNKNIWNYNKKNYFSQNSWLYKKVEDITQLKKFKIKAIPVIVLNQKGKVIDSFSSMRAASTKYGLADTTLKRIYLDTNKLYKNKYYFERAYNYDNIYKELSLIENNLKFIESNLWGKKVIYSKIYLNIFKLYKTSITLINLIYNNFWNYLIILLKLIIALIFKIIKTILNLILEIIIGFIFVISLAYFIEKPEILIVIIRNLFVVLSRLILINYQFNIYSNFYLLVNSVIKKNHVYINQDNFHTAKYNFNLFNKSTSDNNPVMDCINRNNIIVRGTLRTSEDNYPSLYSNNDLDLSLTPSQIPLPSSTVSTPTISHEFIATETINIPEIYLNTNISNFEPTTPHFYTPILRNYLDSPISPSSYSPIINLYRYSTTQNSPQNYNYLDLIDLYNVE